MAAPVLHARSSDTLGCGHLRIAREFSIWFDEVHFADPMNIRQRSNFGLFVRMTTGRGSSISLSSPTHGSGPKPVVWAK